jgi:SAM-dependent methyltransferase
MGISAVDHWGRIALLWSFLGPPLRPSPEDGELVRRAIETWAATMPAARPTSLVLGVTPELRSAAGNAGTRVIAVDRSQGMIRTVCTGTTGSRDGVVCADWRSLPLASKSVDLVLADGSFTLLAFPSGNAELCGELLRVLRSPGRCVLRCFVQAEAQETCEQVFADLSRGRIGNFRVLRWRLAMALQTDARAGARVGQIWNALEAAFPDLDALADDQGWSREELRSIEFYRGSSERYSFPTLAEQIELFRTAGFRIVSLDTPAYELGDRCPTLVLERR